TTTRAWLRRSHPFWLHSHRVAGVRRAAPAGTFHGLRGRPCHPRGAREHVWSARGPGRARRRDPPPRSSGALPRSRSPGTHRPVRRRAGSGARPLEPRAAGCRRAGRAREPGGRRGPRGGQSGHAAGRAGGAAGGGCARGCAVAAVAACRSPAIPEARRVPARTGFTARHITVDGTALRYIDEGRGPPVVFLHGLGASMYAWRKNLAPVAAAGYRVIAFDNRGFGFS